MQVNDLLFFPTLVSYIENFLDKEQCKKIIKLSKNKKFKKHSSLTGKAKSNHGVEDFILDEISKDLKNLIINCLDSYTEKLGISKVKITNSWVNFQNKGSRLLEHVHPGHKVSGVIYLKVDDKSSKIFFYNPNLFVKFMEKNKDTIYNFDYNFIKPKIGDLILFPSWLSHSSHSDVNNSTERVALSFNAN